MTLSLRRFPQTITRRRQGPGVFDSCGEFQPGATTETELRASVQPLSIKDEDLEEGSRLTEKIKVYVPNENALLAAFDDREADKVVYAGETYVVEESRSWPGGHTRATLLREI